MEFTGDSVPFFSWEAWGEGFGNNTTTIVTVPCGTRNDYFGALNGAFLNVVESTPALSATSNNDNWGVVQVLSAPTCSTPAVVNAVPTSGFHFDHWSDGSTLNPYSFTVDGDTDIIAYFAPDGGTNGIDDATQEGVTIAIQGTTLTIRGADGKTSVVTDLMGRTLYSGITTSRIELPATGVYFVRVGDRPARKVVALR